MDPSEPRSLTHINAVRFIEPRHVGGKQMLWAATTSDAVSATGRVDLYEVVEGEAGISQAVRLKGVEVFGGAWCFGESGRVAGCGGGVVTLGVENDCGVVKNRVAVNTPGVKRTFVTKMTEVGGKVVGGTDVGSVAVVDVESGVPVAANPLRELCQLPVVGVHHVDSSLFAVVSTNGVVLWDENTRKTAGTIRLDKEIRCSAVRPDQQETLLATTAGTLLTYDLRSSTFSSQLPLPSSNPTAITLHTPASLFLATSEGGIYHLSPAPTPVYHPPAGEPLSALTSLDVSYPVVAAGSRGSGLVLTKHMPQWESGKMHLAIMG